MEVAVTEQLTVAVPENSPPAMTFDEVSMERSKSFVNALQELKNLRPQLYSAAEYCEKSYLHSEQKQMVLDNLKDYAVRALVNAVDHLGTVAYKLTDLLEQQTVEVSTMELKVSCVKQQLLTCRTYTDKEGIRQQQLLAIIPRHHKHYVLPNSVGKKVHFRPHMQTDARQNQFRSRLQPSGSPAAKSLSWHLASETKSTLTPQGERSAADSKALVKTTAAFQLLDKDDNNSPMRSSAPSRHSLGGPASNAVTEAFGGPHRESMDSTKTLTAFRSFDNPRRETMHVPTRSKSMLSAFFVKQKTTKMKAGYGS